MCWGKILSELLNFSIRLKNCICSLIPLLGLLSHFVGNPGGGTLIKFWKLSQEVRRISMSKIHPPERNTDMGVGLFEIHATCFWGKMWEKRHLLMMRAPIQNGPGRVRCCKWMLNWCYIWEVQRIFKNHITQLTYWIYLLKISRTAASFHHQS